MLPGRRSKLRRMVSEAMSVAPEEITGVLESVECMLALNIAKPVLTADSESRYSTNLRPTYPHLDGTDL